MELSSQIKNLLESDRYTTDSIGKSESRVLLFEDKVLKIQTYNSEVQNELDAMRWLEGRLSVPQLIHHECVDGKSYLLMTRLPGQMACSEHYMRTPERLVTLLVNALQSLWRVDISACPLGPSLDMKLRKARHNVERGLVDLADTQPETFGPGGFESPAALLTWLEEHRPVEEPVLSHGDFCLPNILIQDDGSLSFIDLGQAGISDKWQDIALCYRSLLNNYSGKYGGKRYPAFDPDMLFEKFDLEPDEDKLRYYLLLDELL